MTHSPNSANPVKADTEACKTCGKRPCNEELGDCTTIQDLNPPVCHGHPSRPKADEEQKAFVCAGLPKWREGCRLVGNHTHCSDCGKERCRAHNCHPNVQENFPQMCHDDSHEQNGHAPKTQERWEEEFDNLYGTKPCCSGNGPCVVTSLAHIKSFILSVEQAAYERGKAEGVVAEADEVAAAFNKKYGKKDEVAAAYLRGVEAAGEVAKKAVRAARTEHTESDYAKFYDCFIDAAIDSITKAE